MSDNKNGNESKKYSQTMAKAGVGGASGEETTLLTKDEAEWISPMSDDEFAKMMADGDFEHAPRNAKLDEGQKIFGFLEGNGPEAEFERDDGSTQIVKTWIFRHPVKGIRMSILSSVQLDKMLPPFIGSKVYVRRGKSVNIGGSKRMTEYYVWGEWEKDPVTNARKPRTWAETSPVIDARGIESAPQRRSLPSGGNAGGNAEDAS